MSLLETLLSVACPKTAEGSARFFKTQKGEYGEGDMFLGIFVPEVRKVAKKFLHLSDAQIAEILKNPFHEVRLCGLFVLVYQFEKADTKRQEEIFLFYQENLEMVNNWDLVDVSAFQILGNFLQKNPHQSRIFLYDFAKSKNLWKRRIAILTTFAFLKAGEFDDTLQIAKILLHDSHDLIHKAVGWMLREMGKKDEKILKNFLYENASTMPRTMLRYAIEKFEETERKRFLRKEKNSTAKSMEYRQEQQ